MIKETEVVKKPVKIFKHLAIQGEPYTGDLKMLQVGK